MKLGNVLCCLLLGVLILYGCDDKKDDFAGLSDLVQERNKVRKLISEETARKKGLEKQGAKATGSKATGVKVTGTTDKISQKKGASSTRLYGRDVEIVDSFSRAPLAKGVAYLNKEGKIVKLKIIKE